MMSDIFGQIKLPLQGVGRNDPFIYPRRCHWAKLSWAFSPKSGVAMRIIMIIKYQDHQNSAQSLISLHSEGCCLQ